MDLASLAQKAGLDQAVSFGRLHSLLGAARARHLKSGWGCCRSSKLEPRLPLPLLLAPPPS